jgi:hypothetical protein
MTQIGPFLHPQPQTCTRFNPFNLEEHRHGSPCSDCTTALNYVGMKMKVQDCDAMVSDNHTVCFYCASIVTTSRQLYDDPRHNHDHFPRQNPPAIVQYLTSTGKRRNHKMEYGLCRYRIEDMA